MCLYGLIKRIRSTAGNKTLVYSISTPGKKWRSVCNLATAVNRDTLIKVGPHVISAHSLVLAAVSPFMEASFRFNGYRIKKFVDLSAVLTSEISLNRIMGHFYCRWVKLDDDFLPEILDASAFLMCETLTFKCSQFLLKSLTAENCFSTWIVAEMYNLPHLALVCRDFLRELIPSVTECIHVEKIPEWFWKILLESMGSELCGSAFKLIIQLKNWLSIHSDHSDFISKLLLSYYFNEDYSFSKILSQGINQTSGSFVNIVRELDVNALTDCGVETKEPYRHSVVFVKEDGDPSIALYCVIGKCWTSLTLPHDYGSIIGVVNEVYLVFLCTKTHEVTFYHMPTAQIFPIRNVFPNDLNWMETYNLSRAYFVSDGKLYIAFSTRNSSENTVLLNVFSYCLSLKKWKLCFNVRVPGIWNMCIIQALTTEDNNVHIVMHAYYFNLLTTEQFPNDIIPAANCKTFIFCIKPRKLKMKRFCTVPRRNSDKPVFILNKKEYILLDHKLYQSYDKPLTWSARLQMNDTGDEICYNIPLSTTPVPRIKTTDISDVFCVAHMYMSSDTLVIAQHRAPTVLWVYTFNLHSRKLMMLPPVPVNATSRNIQVASFYSSVPLSSMLKKTVKTIIRDKCYFKDMTFDDCSSTVKERDNT